MNKTLRTLFIALAMVASNAMAGTPIEAMVPVDHIYVPTGFDSNDSSEVIVTGFLPNMCHKSPSHKVEINGDKINIKVTSLYYHESNPFCPEVIVPFTESVTLGVMDKGNYQITVNGKSPWTKKAKIMINESTSNSVDEHQYAYVEYVEKEEASRVVTLKGYNPSDCFVLDKVDFISNKKDTFSVLPKLKQIREFCPMKMVPFEYEVTVPTGLSAEKVLLHVRTMDGTSVNRIFENLKR
jgi:hypothetical protein